MIHLPARLLLAVTTAAVVVADGPARGLPQRALSETLVVVESSILLQRSDRTRAENVRIAIDGIEAESLAIYPVEDIELPTVLYFDLCVGSYSRLLHAVAMIVAASKPLLRAGPISVVVGNKTGSKVLQEGLADALSLEAALASILRRRPESCVESATVAFFERLRSGLAALDARSPGPSLLVVYGVNHEALGVNDLERFGADYATAGKELAAQGRTTVVLLPEEGNTKLKEEEVRPFLRKPDDPGNVINLGALFDWLFFRKHAVPNDSRIIALALDPRNRLVRKLTVPSRGGVFAFPRQLEAFSLRLRDYHVLFYRLALPAAKRDGSTASVEVRMRRSGDLVPTALVVGRGTLDAAAKPDGAAENSSTASPEPMRLR